MKKLVLIILLLYTTYGCSDNFTSGVIQGSNEKINAVFCSYFCDDNSRTNCCNRQRELYTLDSYYESMNTDSIYTSYVICYSKQVFLGGATRYIGAGSSLILNKEDQIESLVEKFSFNCNYEGLILARELLSKLNSNDEITTDFCKLFESHEFLFTEDLCN
jgi:hypothetical protein